MKNVIEERLKYGKYVIIAEIGVNYYDIAVKYNISPLAAAKLMIEKAKSAGVHAVKFQTYKAETLAVKDSPYYWDINEEPTRTQYELFKKFDSFGEREYEELYRLASTLGIEFLSTPFDVFAADYLDKFMNVYKISSSDLNNLKFIEYLARKNKPIILSVGASCEEEIGRAIKIIRSVNDKFLVLMHCVLEYPTLYEHANLNKIVTLARKFPDAIIGYSDHTKPDEHYDVIKTAYNLGALVIEKHFTLDKTLKGNDHYHAMDFDDACKIISSLEYLEIIRGKYQLEYLPPEKIARENARRSIVAARNIVCGEIINEEAITWKRPGTGIPADQFDNVVGKTAKMDIAEDTILQYTMLQ